MDTAKDSQDPIPIQLRLLSGKAGRLADKLLGEWAQPPGITPEAVQSRYLYCGAVGARRTAASYWRLREFSCDYDCHVLARTLLERIFNNRYAAQSPRDAVCLFCCELSERITRAEKFPLNSGPEGARFAAELMNHRSELSQFLSLVGLSKAPKLDVFARTARISLENLYRTGYWFLSRFAHPGYDTSRPGEYPGTHPFADFVAVLAPMDTAAQLHAAATGNRTDAEILAEYTAIYDELKRATILA